MLFAVKGALGIWRRLAGSCMSKLDACKAP